MSKVIDLFEHRKARQEDDHEYILVCDCGCALFRIYASSTVTCVNCEAEMEGLLVDAPIEKN